MHKSAFFYISFLFIIFSTNSNALPVRYDFVGQVENSSFGYEGKTITGWYEYDYEKYVPDDSPYINGLLSYSLTVGDLEIVADFTFTESSIYSSDGTISGFWTRTESPYDLSGRNYGLDTWEMSFTNGLPGPADDYLPTPQTLDFSHLKSGRFEILGQYIAVLPDQSDDVFWLTGSLQQVDASRSVPEPSLALIFVAGLVFLFKLRRRTSLKSAKRT